MEFEKQKQNKQQKGTPTPVKRAITEGESLLCAYILHTVPVDSPDPLNSPMGGF